MQVVSFNDDAFGRILYESASCVTIMLSRATQDYKASFTTPSAELVSAPVVKETLNRILDHAKTSGLVDHLCLCLATSGSSLNSGSSNMLRAACETCRALWALIDAVETDFMKGKVYLFPLNVLQNHSLQCTDMRDQERGSLVGIESARIVDLVTRAFLQSKAVQHAINYCLHQRLETALSASLQVFVLIW